MTVSGIGVDRVKMMPGWKVTLNNQIWLTWRIIAEEMEAVAKRFAAVDSGEMVSKIKGITRRDGTAGDGTPVAEVIAAADHSKFVEYGTGRRGQATTGPDVPPGYKHGPSKGMEAQPFLRPALEDALRRWFGVF